MVLSIIFEKSFIFLKARLELELLKVQIRTRMAGPLDLLKKSIESLISLKKNSEKIDSYNLGLKAKLLIIFIYFPYIPKAKHLT